MTPRRRAPRPAKAIRGSKSSATRHNRGKAERLNLGFERASHPLVVVTDADTNLHPLAVKLMVARIERSPRVAAVAGAPYVTNRKRFLSALQSLEAASIIGLIRRTRGSRGGSARSPGCTRDLPARGGARGRRLRRPDGDRGHRALVAAAARRLVTTYEPEALVGMQVPTTLGALWASAAGGRADRAKC